MCLTYLFLSPDMVVLDRWLILRMSDFHDLRLSRVAHRADLLQQELLELVLVLRILVKIDEFSVR